MPANPGKFFFAPANFLGCPGKFLGPRHAPAPPRHHPGKFRKNLPGRAGVISFFYPGNAPATPRHRPGKFELFWLTKKRVFLAKNLIICRGIWSFFLSFGSFGSFFEFGNFVNTFCLVVKSPISSADRCLYSHLAPRPRLPKSPSKKSKTPSIERVQHL